jgi:hypothetical protein
VISKAVEKILKQRDDNKKTEKIVSLGDNYFFKIKINMITARVDALEKIFKKHYDIAFRTALDEAALKGVLVNPIEDTSPLDLAESLFVIELKSHFPMMAKLRKSIIRSHVESIGLTYDKSESYWALDLVEENNKTLSFSKRIKVDKIAAFCDMLNGMRYKRVPRTPDKTTVADNPFRLQYIALLKSLWDIYKVEDKISQAERKMTFNGANEFRASSADLLSELLAKYFYLNYAEGIVIFTVQ